MTASLQQLMAASALVVTLERIASSGVLPADDEANIRLLICRACRAFEIPTIAERTIAEAPGNIAIFERVASPTRC